MTTKSKSSKYEFEKVNTGFNFFNPFKDKNDNYEEGSQFVGKFISVSKDEDLIHVLTFEDENGQQMDLPSFTSLKSYFEKEGEVGAIYRITFNGEKTSKKNRRMTYFDFTIEKAK